MKSETVLAIGAIGAVAIIGFMLYKHYQMNPQNSATFSAPGISGNVNLNPLISGVSSGIGNLVGGIGTSLGGIFSGGHDDGSDYLF